MPTSSIDTFFACALLVVLIVSSMAVLPKTLSPLSSDLANKSEDELLQQLAQYIMFKPGTPSNWGSYQDTCPGDFGLASSATQPYTLDTNKVTRLNNKNAHALTYAQLLDSLRIGNVALRIQIQTVFETSINLISILNNGNATSYSFEIATDDSGLVVVADLSCYVIISDHVDHTAYCTNSSGKTMATFTISNSLNGSALLAVFARASVNQKVGSFGVYPFSHNASAAEESGTFLRLSPLNCALSVSLNYAGEQILQAYAFSYGYWANLNLLSNTTRTAEYAFPHFCDKSITLLVLTGLNRTKSFVEWETYPQIPLTIGVNFDASNSSSNVASNDYVVTIGAAYYRMRVQGRRVG